MTADPLPAGGAARRLGLIGVTAGVYLLLGALGLGFASANGYASPIFPAAGFAVAMLLWSHRRAAVGIWLGSLLLNLGLAQCHGDLSWRSAGVAAGIASGSTLQALAAWWLVQRRVPGWRVMERECDIVAALALAGPLACLISASIGSALLLAAGGLQATELPYAWWRWWSGDTLGVLVLLPLSLTALYRDQPPWRGRLLTMALPMAVTLTLMGGAFVAVYDGERAQLKAGVRRHGEALAQLLQQRFIAHQEALAALRRLIEVTPAMSRAQFDTFTRMTLSDNPDISALSINPYVRRAERAAFEQRMAQQTGSRFEIRERNPQQRLVRAADRAAYVPVGYIAPLPANAVAVGFDIQAEPLRADALRRAMQTGRAAVTAPIQLVQEQRRHAGVLLLQPAQAQLSGLSASDAAGATMGFAVAVIKVDQMVQIATRAAAVEGLVFQVDDAAAPGAAGRLYRSVAAAQPADPFYT